MNRTFFGGTLLKRSHAKRKRPLSTRYPVHIVLRSSRAKGARSFLKKENANLIKALLKKQARSFRIKVLSQLNQGSCLHLVIKGRDRKQIQNFLRTISALIARYVQQSHKGNASVIRFWDQRPFTRILEGNKGFRVALRFLCTKELLDLGVIPRSLYFSSA